MDISKLNLEQLKALAYDLLVQKEQIVKNLQVVNQSIIKKEKEMQEAQTPAETAETPAETPAEETAETPQA